MLLSWPGLYIQLRVPGLDEPVVPPELDEDELPIQAKHPGVSPVPVPVQFHIQAEPSVVTAVGVPAVQRWVGVLARV
jgi:hypothetical protein